MNRSIRIFSNKNKYLLLKSFQEVSLLILNWKKNSKNICNCYNKCIMFHSINYLSLVIFKFCIKFSDFHKFADLNRLFFN